MTLEEVLVFVEEEFLSVKDVERNVSADILHFHVIYYSYLDLGAEVIAAKKETVYQSSGHRT